jgi:predicted nucleic acid-binding protein
VVVVFADTSALVALVDVEHERHEATRRWLSDTSSDLRIVTTNYVLSELFAVLDRRKGREAVRGFRIAVQPVLGLHWLTPKEHELALDFHINASRRSSFVDQTSFLVMRDAEIETAFALDEDFVLAGFAVVP